VFESQLHDPFVVSHRPVEHELHAIPPLPHRVGDSEAYRTHVVPSQQPAGHVAGPQVAAGASVVETASPPSPVATLSRPSAAATTSCPWSAVAS
jgi:hypothetical protein